MVGRTSIECVVEGEFLEVSEGTQSVRYRTCVASRNKTTTLQPTAVCLSPAQINVEL